MEQWEQPAKDNSMGAIPVYASRRLAEQADLHQRGGFPVCLSPPEKLVFPDASPPLAEHRTSVPHELRL